MAELELASINDMDESKKAIDKFEISVFNKGFYAKLFDLSYSRSIQNHYDCKYNLQICTVDCNFLNADEMLPFYYECLKLYYTDKSVVKIIFKQNCVVFYAG